ncbi:MAG: hypothetical protein GY754_23755, partial [bacterium]|nr:hypothetical protein [bacterium]
MTIPRLRLIDKPSEGGKSDKIEIIVQYEDETLNYTADYFPSPVDQKFREKLHWYFKDYLVHPYGKNQQLGRVFPSEINKIGRLMGDQLFGEDYPLFTQIGKLDEIGMEQVIVTLESERAEFFDEPWELLLLPDTERALAASCAGFIRTRYKDPEPAAAMKLEAENKLRILMVMPWPENQGTLNSYSNASLIMNGFFEYEQSIDVEILKTASREGLEKRLADKELPVHIVYFCGFAGYDAAAAALSAGYLIFEDSKDGEERVSTDSAAQLLKENGVSILFLDLHQSPVPDEAPVENTMNTSIALELMQYGLEGVVTMSHASYTFSTSEYFRTIFSQIAGGKSLGQAVAESRKFMLNECSQDTLTSQKTDFYDWPLALHYGQYDISVFPQPLEPVPLVQTRSYSNVRNTVIGFKNEMLPPNLFLGRDKEFHHIENTFHRNSIILLYGSQGIGKTHLAHQYAYWFA